MLYPSIKKLKKNEKGSFTIEASLIFPIIFLVTILFLFFSLYIYERVQLYQRAAIAADRIAYVWDNSHKDGVTGTLQDPSENDGLYWRLGQNGFLLKLVEGFTGDSPAEIEIGMNYAEGSLIEQKLYQIADTTLPDNATGTVYFNNGLFENSIVVDLEKKLAFPSFIEKAIGSTVNARAEAQITDPVEFIRTVELVRVYAQELTENFNIIQQQKKENKSKK